jgi:hypothetical protein
MQVTKDLCIIELLAMLGIVVLCLLEMKHVPIVQESTVCTLGVGGRYPEIVGILSKLQACK